MRHSTRPSGAPLSLALSCVGSMLLPLAGAHAQETDAGQPTPKALGGVTVSSTAISDEDVQQQETPKATRPVRDMPQTITIIPHEVIQQQNLLSLQDVLTTIPGITFGAGEGGNGFGDKVNLRGYAADSDITIDQVRDSASYSRSDVFNIEQVEVTNGADSVYSGVGSVGGTINLVTKRPTAENKTIVTGAVGTDDYWRGTIDANRKIGDGVAVRLNAMVHRNDLPGRKVEDAKRWGVAPAVTFGLDSPTSVTLQYYHQEDHNIPEYGVPYYRAASDSGALPGVSRSDYFGYRNVDTQRINVDQATVTVNHEFSDTVSIRNLARWQDVKQLSRVDPPQGTYCLAGGVSATGTTCAYPGYYLPSGPRGTTRDGDNHLLYDQVDLKAKLDTAGIEHTITLGGSASQEKYDLLSGNSLRNADGTAVYTTYPLINIDDPDTVVPGPGTFTYGSNVYTGPINFIPTAHVHSEVENYAVYLFDAAKLLPKLELNGGVRLERNTGRYRSDTISAATATLGQITPGATFRNKDSLFSYRVGLVYKPVEAVSLYAAYGNSHTPSQSSVNGSCTVATCNVKPEGAREYEIGAKAQVADGILLAASLFRNERNQYKVASNDPSVPDQQLDGRSRTQGVTLSAIGKVTKAWQVTANYAYIESKVIQGVSDFCEANPTVAACSGTNVPLAGLPLTFAPKHSGSLFTTYQLPFGLQLGYGLTYQGVYYLNNGTGTIYKAPDYLIHQASLSYPVTSHLLAQLNVKNFTDKHYYTRIRNNGWATPGDAPQAVLSISYSF